MLVTVCGVSAQGVAARQNVAMDFNVTEEQWVERFAFKLAQLETGAEPEDLIRLGRELCPIHGHLLPEDAAQSQFDRTMR